MARGGRSASGGAVGEKQLLGQRGSASPQPPPPGPPFSPEGPGDMSCPVTVMVAPPGLMPGLLFLRLFPVSLQCLMRPHAGKKDRGLVLS